MPIGTNIILPIYGIILIILLLTIDFCLCAVSLPRCICIKPF